MDITCRDCKQTKPFDSFHRHPKASHGRNTRCKDCERLYQKAYAKRNGAKKAAYSREYRARPENKAKARAYVESHRERFIWHSAKRRARERGLKFTIEVADIVIPELCPVFKTPLVFGDRGMTDDSPSIDRIDNAKGYEKGNVWVISYHANRLKSDASLKELETLVGALRSKVTSS